MRRAKSVDEYLDSASLWREELRRLRDILRSTGLKEEVKWGSPCYTLEGKNVVGIGGFKSYFGLWFHQGALLEDEKQLLINAQEGKTKALRQWRMRSAADIKPALIKRYVKEAAAIASEGREIKPARAKELEIPSELSQALAENKGAAKAFSELRPGQRREYAEYVGEAKREATRARRVEKVLPMILAGIGLNDRYRT